MEGEELPIDMLGPATKRRHLNLGNLHWPQALHLPGRHSTTLSQEQELHRRTEDAEQQAQPAGAGLPPGTAAAAV